MNEIKNLSKKSARPAMIATKNQKQTIGFTIVSTEGGMYNKVLLRVCKKVVQEFVEYGCMKNENYIKKGVIYVIYLGCYVLYILIVIYLDP